MKKQINPTIKAHLLRGALYAPMLVAVCAIPFALAQQGSKKTAANHAASGDMPVVQSSDGVFRSVQAVQDQPGSPLIPTGAPCTYSIAQIGGSIVPGTTDIGNHGDDTVVTIALPFSYTLYDQTFTSINLSSNGNAQFTTTDTTFTNVCLPWTSHNYTIFPYWDDQYLVNSGFGIFTSISGTAPHRIFNIEWRAQYFPGSGSANYELRLYEGQTRFDVIYGTLTNANTSATAGVQQNDTNFQQYFCNGSGGAATGGQSYTLVCPTPTPPCSFTGSIDTSDPTQTDRLFRSGFPQTCPASTSCAIFGDATPHHYDAYTLINTTGATQCVTVDTNTACTGTNFVFVAAYLGSFDPNNICTNWIGDSGFSPNPDQPFSFNLDNGQTVVLVVSENTPDAGCPAYTMTVDGLCETIVPTDFNHDRFPDFVLFNGGTHRTAIWFLNNNSFMGSAFGPTLPAGWNLIDTGDFDGDSDVDYVLFNATTRHTAIWYLTGTTFMSGAFGPMLPSGWALVATGDFNGDGHPDYVLYNASSRRTAIWFLNNNVFTSASFGPTVPAGWSLAGVADFNHDGNLDYALFNAGTRQTAIWHLNGTSFMSSAFGPTPPPGWALIGVADFDRNGSPDYVLFNAAMRKTAIWYLDNNVFVSGAFGPTLVAGFNLVAP